MINGTFSLEIKTFNETYDKGGVKLLSGDCSVKCYSKNEFIENTFPFRVKGSTAVTISELGIGSTGVAIGYPDLKVIDSGHGYKEKRCTLVIQDFISIKPSSNFSQTNDTPGLTATASKNKQSPDTPSHSEIPF